MKVFHYTKCNRLYSIFQDGFIATELKRSLNPVGKNTNYVWLTEKQTYPKTALPLLSNFPETSLALHLRQKNIVVDLGKIGQIFGNFYRFGFDSDKADIKKWFFSEQREVARQNAQWAQMESTANKVGDDVRSFWFSEADLPLENFSLEFYENGQWNSVFSNASLSALSNEHKELLEMHKEISRLKCVEFGVPFNNQSPN